MNSNLYPAFSQLLDYPVANWQQRLDECHQEIMRNTTGLRSEFDPFLNELRLLRLAELQEIYTQTFDLNPVCTLDIGYHLFGENYKRGLFLAKLRETEAQYGLPEEGQLPDYLPIVLRLLGQPLPDDLRSEMIGECLLPALGKMLESLKDKNNPYTDLLRTIRAALVLEACASESSRVSGNGR